MSEQPETVTGAVAGVSKKLIEALPASFLALCLVNILFIGTVFWFESRQTAVRMQLIADVLRSCVARIEPHAS
jgi:hypothetical protein